VLEPEPPEQTDGAANPEQALEQAQLSARVRAAVDALPPRQRAAVALCHFEELGNVEAAEILDVSVEALESLLSRGRRALRAALSAEATDGGAL
jgi:RNA polymerase sigma-70 factor (ECF subfamily)